MSTSVGNGTDHGKRTPAEKLKSVYKQWRTFQVSDHFPMWIELKMDFSDGFIAKCGGLTGKKAVHHKEAYWSQSSKAAQEEALGKGRYLPVGASRFDGVPKKGFFQRLG